ncbi:MAG: rhodanese-like domain-containing protein [Myxococcota bacterium]|nr:rhodanese-like domain-containing protein [Myxococcota bacterium]
MPRAKKHSIRFLNLVDDAKTRIKEISVEKLLEDMKYGKLFNIIDVREEREYLLSHIPNARHIGKGVIERDIERRYRNLDEQLILYCGGGYRSALAADSLQKMGYTNVLSMEGGFRSWKLNGGDISIDI